MMVVEAYSAEMVRLILSMTFTGSILAGLLFILKPVIKEKLPETFQYYMWFPVVTALLVPVSKIMVMRYGKPPEGRLCFRLPSVAPR